jgi:hypothetical protein
MIDTVVKLLPALLGIALGYVLRLRGVADRRDADFMFRLIITVFLPALAFTALSRVSIGRDLAIFPLAALVIVAVGYLTGRLLAAKGPFLMPQQAVAICCCMNVNTGFMLPFVQGLYGADGVARIAAFDAVNTTLMFTWTAYVAARGNPHHGLLVSAFGLHVPVAIGDPFMGRDDRAGTMPPDAGHVPFGFGLRGHDLRDTAGARCDAWIFRSSRGAHPAGRMTRPNDLLVNG